MTLGHGHHDTVRTLAFSPTSGLLVSGSKDRDAIVWSVPALRSLHVLKGSRSSIRAALFLSDDRIATGSHDKTIRVWSAETGASVREIEAHGDMVNSIVLSTDKRQFASSSDDRTVKLYDIQTYSIVGTVRCEGKVMSLSSVRDGVYMAGIEQQGVVSVDFESGLASLRIVKCKIPRGIVVVRGVIVDSKNDITDLAPRICKELTNDVVFTEPASSRDQEIELDKAKPTAMTSQVSVDPSSYARVGFRPVTAVTPPAMIVTPSCKLYYVRGYICLLCQCSHNESTSC